MSFCVHHHHPPADLFSSGRTADLHLLNSSSPSFLCSCIHHPPLSFCEFDDSRFQCSVYLLCLAYFSIMSSSFINVIAYVRMSFSKAGWCSVISVYTLLSIHLPIDLLAIMNDAAMNVGIQTSFWVPAFNTSGYTPIVYMFCMCKCSNFSGMKARQWDC